MARAMLAAVAAIVLLLVLTCGGVIVWELWYSATPKGDVESLLSCQLDCWPRTIYARDFRTEGLISLRVYQFPEEDAAFVQELTDRSIWWYDWQTMPMPCAPLDVKLFDTATRPHIAAMQDVQNGYWLAGLYDGLFVYDTDAHVLYLCRTEMNIRQMMQEAGHEKT